MNARPSRRLLSRRQLLAAGAATAGSALLAGCDDIAGGPPFRAALDFGELVSMRLQRLLLAGQPLVREYAPELISQDFPPNGTEMPAGFPYFELMISQFARWRLTVDGLVEKELSLSLDELKAMPARSQITQHNCDEGWTAIGQWTGAPLAHVLGQAKLKSEARYIVFHCLDEMVRTADRSGFYYESIDLFDAFHPQTILAYEMNGSALPVRHGAPLRLRVERQVGYKHAKFITRIEAVDRLDRIGRGKGGFWEDRGYQWYGGL
jgi:DMSO/TMAO reductase YedYZ molybdopterin-dependent catalytic subunit